MTEAPLLVERTEDETYTPHEHEPRLLLLESVQIEVGLDERVLQGIADVERLTRLPMQLIEKYAEVAGRHATLKRHPDGWVATVLGFQGVWAKERTKERTLEVLKEVVQGWTLLKIQHGDKDLPVIEEIDLNVL
jgi:hypothetical protein